MASSLGVMQPYFFPYIGYYQLINAVDFFVIHDDVQYIKSGWINRNRIIVEGAVKYITLPISLKSHTQLIEDTKLTDDHIKHKQKIVRVLHQQYHTAPYFDQCFSFLESLIVQKEQSAAKYLRNQIIQMSDYLGIKTKIMTSSKINLGKNTGRNRVDKLCSLAKSHKSNVYINLPGGKAIYSKEEFNQRGIELKFINPCPIDYQHHKTPVTEQYLSIIDLLMHISREDIHKHLDSYTLS